MGAVMDLEIKLWDVEIDYTAFAPDPDTGDEWTFEIHKVSYSFKRKGYPPIEIGDWLSHVYEDEILQFLTNKHIYEGDM